jgi:hypothetical protein
MPSDEEVTQRAGSLQALTGFTERACTVLRPPFEPALAGYRQDRSIAGLPRPSRRYRPYGRRGTRDRPRPPGLDGCRPHGRRARTTRGRREGCRAPHRPGVPRGWGPAACRAAHGRRGPRRPGPGPARGGPRPRLRRHRLYGPASSGGPAPKAITTPPRAGGGHTPVASRTGDDAHSPGPGGSSWPRGHRVSARLVHQAQAGR